MTDTAVVVKCMKCKATKKVYKSDNPKGPPFCDCGHYVPMMARNVWLYAQTYRKGFGVIGLLR